MFKNKEKKYVPVVSFFLKNGKRLEMVYSRNIRKFIDKPQLRDKILKELKNNTPVIKSNDSGILKSEIVAFDIWSLEVKK